MHRLSLSWRRNVVQTSPPRVAIVMRLWRRMEALHTVLGYRAIFRWTHMLTCWVTPMLTWCVPFLELSTELFILLNRVFVCFRWRNVLLACLFVSVESKFGELRQVQLTLVSTLLVEWKSKHSWLRGYGHISPVQSLPCFLQREPSDIGFYENEPESVPYTLHYRRIQGTFRYTLLK